jgi:hypothetical protein
MGGTAEGKRNRAEAFHKGHKGFTKYTNASTTLYFVCFVPLVINSYGMCCDRPGKVFTISL